jgi:hypothetical protein
MPAWVAGAMLVAGAAVGFGLCRAYWPSERIRSVEVVRYVDKRVEVPVERVVERRVEVPVVKEVIRYVEKPVPAQTAAGLSSYELEDWAKLRRNMNKESVRVLLGDPLGVSGSGQEIWVFPFNGSATFSSEGKLESWQVPGASLR